MSSGVDDRVAQAMEIGYQNAETIELIEAHCCNARVEITGGVGVVEEMTGLPIGLRTVRCEHAATAVGMSMNLEPIAIDFYRTNCVDCPHRRLVSVPNLATRAAEVEKQEQAASAEQERREREAEEERQGRAEHRRALAQGEGYATAELIRKLDEVDSAAADADAARHIVETARAAPELFTANAIMAVIETARTTGADPLFTALSHLAERGAVDRDALLELALDVLTRNSAREAARVVVDLRAGLRAEAVAPACSALVWLAGEDDTFGFRHMEPPDPEPMLVAATVHLPAVLAAVEKLLGAEEEFARQRGASAAEALIASEPGTAPVLVRRLVAALEMPGSLSPYMGSPRGAILGAIACAIEVAAVETGPLLESLAAGLDGEHREALFHAYDRAISRKAERETPVEAGVVVVDCCFARLSGDWGGDVAVEAASTLSLIARYQPQLLDDRVDALVGYLIRAVAEPPEPAALASVPPQLAALAENSRRLVHGRLLHDLRETLGLLARRRPQSVLSAVILILEQTPPGEQALRANAVELLGQLGQIPVLLPAVLPHLYRALLDEDQLIRATAVDAWREIDGRSRALPSTLNELIPVLVTDPNVIVLRAIVQALRYGVAVADDDLITVANGVLNVARWAAGQPDWKLLEDSLAVLMRLSRGVGDDERLTIWAWCLHLAPQLIVYDLDDFLLGFKDELSAFPAYTDLLLTALKAPELIDRFNQNDYRLIETLRAAPREQIAGRVDGIREAARVHLPDWPYAALEYVEVLQHASLWEEALQLADEVVNAIPDSAEHAVGRTYARMVAAAAEVEAALVSGDDLRAERALRNGAEAGAERAREHQRWP